MKCIKRVIIILLVAILIFNVKIFALNIGQTNIQKAPVAGDDDKFTKTIEAIWKDANIDINNAIIISDTGWINLDQSGVQLLARNITIALKEDNQFFHVVHQAGYSEEWKTISSNIVTSTLTEEEYNQYKKNYQENGTSSDINSDRDKVEDAEGIIQDNINSGKVTPSVITEIRDKVFNNDVLEDIDQYAPNDIDDTSARRIENITSKILTVISNIGIAVSVIMLAVLGVKYMLGSVEEKADYKEGLIPYVIGAFILFGITGFIKILIAIGDKIGNL